MLSTIKRSSFTSLGDAKNNLYNDIVCGIFFCKDKFFLCKSTNFRKKYYLCIQKSYPRYKLVLNGAKL